MTLGSLELSDADVMSALDVLFRWVHVVSAVAWLGFAYFLSWVLGPSSRGLSPETQRNLQLELMPRAMFFYRFAALYTFAFGQLLLFDLYYMAGDYFYRPLTELAGIRPPLGTWLQPFLLLFVGAGLYELLVRSLGKRLPALAALAWAALAVGYAGYLIVVLETSNRAAFVHVAALFATAMVHNTWSHIWPALARVFKAHKASGEPAAEDLAVAGERGLHNLYMAPPVVLLMLSVHISWLTGLEAWYLVLPAIFAIGFAATKALVVKAERLDEEHWTI